MGPAVKKDGDVATPLPTFQRFISNSLEGKRLVKKRLQDISTSASIPEGQRDQGGTHNTGGDASASATGSSDLKKVVTNSLGGLRKKLSSRFLSVGTTDSGGDNKNNNKSNTVGGDSKSTASSVMPMPELKAFKSGSLEGRKLVQEGRNVVQGRIQRMSIISTQVPAGSFERNDSTPFSSTTSLPMPELKTFKSGTLEGKNLVKAGRDVVQGRLQRMSIVAPSQSSSNHNSVGNLSGGDSESFSPSMPELKTFKTGSLEGKNLVQDGRNVVQERLDHDMSSTLGNHGGTSVGTTGSTTSTTQSYALPMPGLQKMVSNSLEGLKKTMQDFSTVSPATGDKDGAKSILSNSSSKQGVTPLNKSSSLRGFNNMVKGTFIPLGKTSKQSLDDDSSDDNNHGQGRLRAMPIVPVPAGHGSTSAGLDSRPAMKSSASIRGFTNLMKGTFMPVGKSSKSSLEDDSSNGNINHGHGRLRDMPGSTNDQGGAGMDSSASSFSAALPAPELKQFFSNSLEGMRNLVKKGRFIPTGKSTKQSLDDSEDAFIPGRLPPNKGTLESGKGGKEEEFVPGRLQLLHGSFLDKAGQHKHQEDEFIPGRLPPNKGTLEGEKGMKEEDFVPGRLQLLHGSFLDNDINHKHQEEFIPGRLPLNKGQLATGNEGSEEEFVPGKLQMLHGNFLDKDDQHNQQEDFIPGRIPPNKGKLVAGSAGNEGEFIPGKLQLLHGNFLEQQALTTWNSNHTQKTCTDLTQEGSGSLTFSDEFLSSSDSSSSSAHNKDVVVDLGNNHYTVKQSKHIQKEALSEEDKIYKAACCIQRFFQYTKEVYDYHRGEITYWEQEKADVLKRHREELAAVRRQMEMEKDQAEVEIQAEMEREHRNESSMAQVELSPVVDWTFSDTSFSWVQDIELMQKIQQEKQTQKRLKEWIRVCTNWNRQLALDEAKLNRNVQDAKAMLRRINKIASVKKKLSIEIFRKERIMNCILQVTQLVKSRIGDEMSIRILNQHLDKRSKPKVDQVKKSSRTSASSSKQDGGRSKSPRRDKSPTRDSKRKSSPSVGANKEQDVTVPRASSPPKMLKKDAKKRDSGRSRSLTRRNKSPQPSSACLRGSSTTGSGKKKKQSRSLSPMRSSGRKGTRQSIKQAAAMRQSVVGSACFLDLIEMDSSFLDHSSRSSFK